MHANHSFVVVAAVKTQFREPSLLQGCWYNPEKGTHRSRWSWREENPVQWWHNLDSSSKKLRLTKKQGQGHTACWWLCSVHGWLSWGLGVQADTSALTVQLGRGLWGSDVSPVLHTTLQSILLTGSCAHKEWNHSSWRCEVYCNHQKPPCWPHWLSIL